MGRLYGPSGLRVILTGFTYAVRGVPGVLAILIIFYALPFVGLVFDQFTSVVLMLAFIQVAYVSEVFRAALGSIERDSSMPGRHLG